MTFVVSYKTVSALHLGRNFTSSHSVEDDVIGEKNITYSATPAEGMMFDEEDGNFTIMAENIGRIHFIITVTSSLGYGYNIPISIEIIDSQENFLQYSYKSSYQYLNNFNIEKYGYNPPNAIYSIIGAPSGISIDPSSGEFSGFPTNYGRFGITVVALDSITGEFLSMSKLEFVVCSFNELTSISFSPNNCFMNLDKTSITVKCDYSGEIPNEGQILNYSISSGAFANHFLAKYSIVEKLSLTYIVKVSNSPSSYPVTIENKLTGFFVTSTEKFIITAACFNEDTSLLVVENNEKIYKVIKDLKVGDEVVTYKHGNKKITHIGCLTMVNNPESITDCMYKLAKSNKNSLSHDLILLGRHNLLVDELSKKQKKKITEIHPVDRIDDKCLLNTMFDDDFEIIDETKEFTYYHLVLAKEKDNIDRRYGVYVNGSEIIAATTYRRDFLRQFTNKE
jgi:hypothetical protein